MKSAEYAGGGQREKIVELLKSIFSVASFLDKKKIFLSKEKRNLREFQKNLTTRELSPVGRLARCLAT